MKIFRFLKIFGFLIAFFIGGFFYSIISHAASITLSPNTLNVIQDGNSNLLNGGLSSYGIFPENASQSDIANMFVTVSQNPVLLGTELLTVKSSQYDVRKLTQDEIDIYSQIYPRLYTSTNNPIEWNDTYYVKYDNGVFSGQLYVDSNGDILNFKPDNNYTYLAFSLGFGGSTLDLSDITNIYDDIFTQLNEQQFLYNEDYDLVNNTVSYYIVMGYIFGLQNAEDTRVVRSLYIPNVYSDDIYFQSSDIRVYQGQNKLYYIYFTYDPSDYIKDVYFSTTSNRDKSYIDNYINSYAWVPRVQTGTYTYNGKTYNYRITIGDSQAFNYAPIDIESFKVYSGSQRQFVLDYNDFSVDPSLCGDYLDIDSYSYIGDSGFTLSDDYYSFDEVQNLNDKLNSLNWELNDTFNPAQKITATNYPLNNTDTIETVIPNTLPFPDSITSNPPIVLNPDLVYEQSIQPELSVAIDSFQNMGIPFIQGISDRYPFSIPWDIANFISRFNSTPTPPAWNFDWNITVGATTYTKHFEGDLSDFNSLAEIFRNLVLISFIIALCKFSYDHHF